MPLPTVGIHSDITRSFEKCVRPQKQQSPKQTRARSQISERFISCARASHTSPEKDVKLPGETFLQRQRTVAADLEGMRHYPQVLIESGKRPDLVLVSSSTDAIILVELTVPPWEDRLQYSNALKADKYANLSMDLEAKGYRTDPFPIEVGARGVVGRSTYAFLAKIGLSSRERKKAMTRMSEAAEAASFWIWHMRSQKKSQATSRKPEKPVDLRCK